LRRRGSRVRHRGRRAASKLLRSRSGKEQRMDTPTLSVAPHVLVVDDDPSMRQMVVDFLGDYDFKVTAVATGAEMSEALTQHSIDLLVLDLRLPD
jgi:PleD family two-component response regulator